MNASTELLLVLGIAGFYLHDASMLLHYNELVIEGRPRQWRVTAGSDMELAGRYVFVPNPLLPGRPMFRTHWQLAGTPAAVDQDALAVRLVLLRPLAWLCSVLLVLLLLVLPALLLFQPYAPALLAVLGVSYAVIACMVAVLWTRRRALGLGARGVLALGFEALICPPYAINLMRKTCLRMGLQGDPVAFAGHVLDDRQRRGLLGQLDARLTLAAAAHSESGDEAARLARYRQYVEGHLQ